MLLSFLLLAFRDLLYSYTHTAASSEHTQTLLLALYLGELVELQPTLLAPTYRAPTLPCTMRAPCTHFPSLHFCEGGNMTSNKARGRRYVTMKYHIPSIVSI